MSYLGTSGTKKISYFEPLDEIGVWKTKHGVAMSGFKTKGITPEKWAAVIDREYWVFGVDCTKPDDIVAAVKIGMQRTRFPLAKY